MHIFHQALTIKKSVLILSAFLMLNGCQTVDTAPNTQTIEKKDNEPFFTYSLPKSTLAQPLIVTPTAIVVEFKFDNGCLLAFNGTDWMTPVFPEDHVKFDIKNKELKLLGQKYRMGEMIDAGGYTTPYISNKIKNITNTPAKECITERLAVFYGDYETYTP